MRRLEQTPYRPITGLLAILLAVLLAVTCTACVGAVDDGVPDGTADTTDDSADTSTTSDTNMPCDGCDIDGSCVDDGAANESNPCEVCVVATSPSAWSSNDGASCEDGLFCNGVEVCVGSDCVTLPEAICPPDDLFCNGEETCNEDRDACESTGDPCADSGEVCSEDNQSCCAANVYQACGPQGDVVWFDGCDQPSGEIVDECAEFHGACADGACQCEPGWWGPDCDACTVFVNIAIGDDNNDGWSWDAPKLSIQAAIDAAASGRCEVWVAQGTYYTTPSTNQALSIQLRSGVDVYGGFVGNEESLDARDPIVYPTILSGDIGAPGETWDNAFHVVTGADNARLDGFTITGGNANGTGQVGTSGGGLLCEGTSPTVVGCVFEDNAAAQHGGGVFVQFASPTFINTRFTRNVAGERGGGLHAVMSSPRIEGCLFEANTADWGGGLYAYSGSPTDPLMLVNTDFVANIASYCGGLGDDSALLLLTGCRFDDNRATETGGGMCLFNASTTITNTVLANNDGGGFGGAIAVNDGNPKIIGCTIANNRASWGAGIQSSSNALTVMNSILWANVANGAVWEQQLDLQNATNSVIRHNDIQGSQSASVFDATNTDVDPRFVVAGYALDSTSTCINAGDTTAIPNDAADLDRDGNVSEPTPFDITGAPRVSGTAVDMGAFEHP